MPRYRITDDAINADYGCVEAPSNDVALDYYASLMGWDDYADYNSGALQHTGIRTLTAHDADEIFPISKAA